MRSKQQRQLPNLEATLAGLDEHLPSRPPAELSPVLDAVERCLTRYGLRRTSMTDIARELRVARTTLYRQVPSIEEAIALVAARQLFVFLDDLVALLSEDPDAQTFIDAAVRTVTFFRTSPLALRVLNEEPDLLGAVLTSGRLPNNIDRIVEVVTPVFEGAMATGSIRSSDPRLTAAVIVRLIVTLILVPAGDALEDLLQSALGPLLASDATSARGGIRQGSR